MFQLEHGLVTTWTCVLYNTFFLIAWGKPPIKTIKLISGFCVETVCVYLGVSLLSLSFHWHWMAASLLEIVLLIGFTILWYRNNEAVNPWAVGLMVLLLNVTCRAVSTLVDFMMDQMPYISAQTHWLSILVYDGITFGILVAMALFLKKHGAFPDRKTSKVNALFLTIPAWMQLCVYDYYRTFPLHNTAFPRLLVLCQLTLAALVVFVCLRLAMQEQLTRQTISGELLQASMIQMENLLKKEEEIKGLRHDLRNHFLVLRHLHEQQKYEEARQYLSAIQDTILSSTTRLYCNDPFVNALLNEKTSQNPAISFEITVDPACLARFESLDLCILLGNLLDNAIRELTEHSQLDPRVRLVLLKKDDMIWLRVENPLSQAKPLCTDKKNASRHGFGLSIVRRRVE